MDDDVSTCCNDVGQLSTANSSRDEQPLQSSVRMHFLYQAQQLCKRLLKHSHTASDRSLKES